ncbi:hypothetical protein HYC85_020780 [Camellia sinensis]|uniref:Amino acid transporter transmembrane domain-containing protein n=1 Tax=Camellia sinensis TaxID=4442 RepID=A0A7J7GUP7_CAMSI|nr:hypothetical protein HYC85_020780 [Camellia sinensis]
MEYYFELLSDDIFFVTSDVLSGTWSDGIHYSGVMEEWFGQQWWDKRSVLLLLTTILVFAPLISFKRLDSLRYTSALSVGLAVVFVVITAGVAIVKLRNGSIEMPRLLPELVDQASFWKLFTTVPILVTAYICHHNIHPIENELQDPSQMKSIVRTSITLCLSVYLATSFFGFLLFGNHTLDDVLANFDADLGIPYSSLLNDVVRVSYCIHLMLVFPIIFFSLRLNLDGLLFPYAIPIAFDNRRFFSVTVALMGFIFLGANFVPSIWDAFQFTGAIATVSVGFIFPAAVCLIHLHSRLSEFLDVASKQLVRQEISPIVMTVISFLIPILQHAEELNKSLIENSATTLGRVAWRRFSNVVELLRRPYQRHSGFDHLKGEKDK